jgi:putative oxidoreductase
MSRNLSARDPGPSHAAYGALILRVALGLVFIVHGLFKPLVLGFPAAVAFFEAFGFPGWTVYPVFLAEVLGGLALILGIGTRYAAAALVVVVLGALRVHVPNGWYFGAPNGGWEFLAVLIAGLAAVFLIGPGSLRLPRARASDRVLAPSERG